MFALKAFGIFVLVTLLDFLWAQYIKHTANAEALKSASYAALISLMGCMVTISYVDDRRMIVPAALGAFVGTYASARFSKKHDP